VARFAWALAARSRSDHADTRYPGGPKDHEDKDLR
jgi:hypothetical protein